MTSENSGEARSREAWLTLSKDMRGRLAQMSMRDDTGMTSALQESIRSNSLQDVLAGVTHVSELDAPDNQ